MTVLQVAGHPVDDIEWFLTYIYGDGIGFAYSPTREPNKGAFSQHFFEYPQERDRLIEHIVRHAPERDVYISPALFSSASISKEAFKQTNVLWAEFDGKLPENLGTIPPPTLRIRSSEADHEHWYFRLDEPLKDWQVVETYNRAITFALEADASGWDCTQVLRPVSTVNHKCGKVVVPVSHSDTTLAAVLFDSVPKPTVAIPKVDLGSIPDITDVVLKYAWPDAAIRWYKQRTIERDRSGALVTLAYYCAEMGMTDAEIFSVIRNADDRWGKFKNRANRDILLAGHIARARTKYPLEVVAAEKLPVYGLQSLLETEIEVEWLIPELLQAQGYMLLTGPAGVGKTQFSLRWAMALALGENFLGYKIEKPHKIVFFSLEMGHADLKYFVAQMAKDYTGEQLEVLETNLLLIPLGEPLYVDSEQGQKQFEAILNEHKPDGFFFDSIGSSTGAELSSETAVKSVMDWNDRLRKRFGVFSWYIHHNRKAQAENKKPNKLSDVYGNIYLVNRATSVYCLWPGNGIIEVIPLKKRLSAMDEPWEVARTGNLNFMKKAKVTFATSSATNVLSVPEDSPQETDPIAKPKPLGPLMGDT